MRTRISWSLSLSLALFALATACDKPKSDDSPSVHAPAMKGDRLPLGLEDLALGVTTEAEALGVFPTPTERSADRSLGGDMVVLRNDAPGVVVTWRSRDRILARAARDGVAPEFAQQQVDAAPGLLPEQGTLAAYDLLELTFAQLAEGAEPVLVSIDAVGDKEPRMELCAFIEKAVGADPEAMRCPGSNRSLGDQRGGKLYCAGDADEERNVFVSCIPGESREAGRDVLEVSLSF